MALYKEPLYLLKEVKAHGSHYPVWVVLTEATKQRPKRAPQMYPNSKALVLLEQTERLSAGQNIEMRLFAKPIKAVNIHCCAAVQLPLTHTEPLCPERTDYS